MVTPQRLLVKQSKWIDCLFCNKMVETKVTVTEKEEGPSGQVQHPHETVISANVDLYHTDS